MLWMIISLQGRALPITGELLRLASLFLSTQYSPVMSSGLSSSSPSDSSSESPVVLEPSLVEAFFRILSFFSPLFLSSLGSSPPGLEPMREGLLLMTVLLAGWDLSDDLLLVEEPPLLELPELEPSCLLEPALLMILLWLSLMAFFISLSEVRLKRQQVPAPRMTRMDTMMRMLRGVSSLLPLWGLAGWIYISLREGSNQDYWREEEGTVY